MNDAIPRPQAKTRKALTPLLEIRNLTKSYDGQHAVDDVSLTILRYYIRAQQVIQELIGFVFVFGIRRHGEDIKERHRPFFRNRERDIHAILRFLRESKLPEWKNLDPELLKLVAKHDPDNKFAMPYMWATTGIGYNVDKVKAVLGENAPVDSWDLILKPENLEKLKSCGVSFLDAPEEVFATVLNYLGKDPNSTKADDYTGPATDLLLKLRPNIRYFLRLRIIFRSSLWSTRGCAHGRFSGPALSE